VFTFSQKASVNLQLLLRLIQSISFLLVLAGLAVAIALTDLSVPDVFACILAFLPTGWGILSVSIISSVIFVVTFLSEICYLFLSPGLIANIYVINLYPMVFFSYPCRSLRASQSSVFYSIKSLILLQNV